MNRSFSWVPVIAGLLILAGVAPVHWVDQAAGFAVGWLSVPYQAAGELEHLLFGDGPAPDAARAVAAGESALDLRRRELAFAIAGAAELKSRPGVAAGVVRFNADEALLQLDVGRRGGVECGRPVTYADQLVGVVDSVDERAEISNARLISRRGVRLFARTRTAPSARLVVAGAGGGRLRVDLCERRDIPDGAAVELAPSPYGDPIDAAVGFTIGTFQRDPDGGTASVIPFPQAAPDRLLQIIVRTENGAPEPQESSEVADWADVDFSPAGDASPGRCSLLGRVANRPSIPVGAAVVFDGWLVGAVGRSGGPAVRVRCAEELGFEVDAILLPPDGRPLPLGRVRCAGRSDRELEFIAPTPGVVLPAGAAGPLVTGNADPGVPKGLRIGDARVKDGRLFVSRPFRGADVAAARIAIPDAKKKQP